MSIADELCAMAELRNTLAMVIEGRMRAYAASEKGSETERCQAIALADVVGCNEKIILAALRHEPPAEEVAALVDELDEAIELHEGHGVDYVSFSASVARSIRTTLTTLSRQLTIARAEVAARDARIAELEKGLGEAREVADDAADLLSRYAAFVSTVPADDLEMHPYRPAIEQAAQDARTFLATHRNADAGGDGR